MRRQDFLQQELVAAIEKSMTFDIAYQKIRPDISLFLTVSEKIPLKNFKAWERFIRDQIEQSYYFLGKKTDRFKHCVQGSLRWLDLCNANGFKREQALKLLPEAAPNSFLLILVARRLNDWVPEVRSAAREALSRLANMTDAGLMVDMLFIALANWNSWGRMGTSERQVLLDIINIPQISQALKNRLLTSVSGPVSTVFTQIGCTAALDNYLWEITQHAIQPTLRAKAYRVLFEKQFVWVNGITWKWIDKIQGTRRQAPVLSSRPVRVNVADIDILQGASLDPSPIVRRIAGEFLIKEVDNIGNNASEIAYLLANDISLSVAERGRFALAELEALKVKIE